MSVREGARRYLRHREPDSTEASIEAWEYRLKLFCEWCQSVGIGAVDELATWDLTDYYELRAAEVAPATLEGEMWTLKMFVEFLDDVGAVDDDLEDAVRIPDVDEEDRSSDTKLDEDQALELLRYYRNSEEYATRAHVWLELAWITGARQGGIRALDVRDFHWNDGDPWVGFRHRPETSSPLKNKIGGERPVAIPTETGAAIQEFIDLHRYDVHDENGRQPLLASAQGRPGPNTVRVWSYLATEPCVAVQCPHGKERETCRWTEYAHASKCPSSRAPHHIRTGAITWMLGLGWDVDDVAERVNADPKTIAEHYDKADLEERRRRRRERMEDRRRPLMEEIEI